jgi:hypothetical protein
MQQVISNNNLRAHQQQIYTATKKENTSLVTRFINWCDQQEGNRFLWLGVSLFGSIGLVLPLTLMMVNFAMNNNFAVWIAAAAVNVPVLAINLAAQPTKITLPFLFVAWATNAGIILYSLALLLLN